MCSTFFLTCIIYEFSIQGTNDVNGNWIIEGYGVAPDIEVENDPKSVLAGRDPQLDRGIQEVLRMMAEKPMKLPPRPPDPVKTKKIETTMQDGEGR